MVKTSLSVLARWRALGALTLLRTGIDVMPHPCGDSLARPFSSDEMPKRTSRHPFIPALFLHRQFAVSFSNISIISA